MPAGATFNRLKKHHNPGAPHNATELEPQPETGGCRVRLARRYRVALQAYMLHPTKTRLQPAQALGRLAQDAGMGLFDLARLHEDILSRMKSPQGAEPHSRKQARAAENFLLEALSPFEAARRGLPEAYVKLERLGHMLKQRNQALVEITARESLAAGALKASKLRYGRLSREASTLKTEVRQHAAKVILAQEEERKRVSRDLHDEIGQALVAVSVGLVLLKKHAGQHREFQEQVTATQAVLEQSMESVHRFARELRPAMLDMFGLGETIASYVRAFSERTGISVDLQLVEDFTGLDQAQEIALFRVTQESLTNISKHAQATHVDIQFLRGAQRLTMEIADNGRAFTVAEKLGSKAGLRLGLLGMQERVRLVHGEFAIKSQVGRGTQVRVAFPLGLTNGANGRDNGNRANGPSQNSGLKATNIL